MDTAKNPLGWRLGVCATAFRADWCLGAKVRSLPIHGLIALLPEVLLVSESGRFRLPSTRSSLILSFGRKVALLALVVQVRFFGWVIGLRRPMLLSGASKKRITKGEFK